MEKENNKNKKKKIKIKAGTSSNRTFLLKREFFDFDLDEEKGIPDELLELS